METVNKSQPGAYLVLSACFSSRCVLHGDRIPDIFKQKVFSKVVK